MAQDADYDKVQLGVGAPFIYRAKVYHVLQMKGSSKTSEGEWL